MKYLAFLASFLLVAHPFHLSTTEIFFNQDQKTLEISLKLFVDDLDDGLEKAGFGKMDLGTSKENENADIFLYKYLLDNFELAVDNKPRKFSFIGKEYEKGNVVWCYLEVKGVKRMSSLYLRNHILTEVFSDQQNIVHVKKDSKTKSLRLRKDKDSGEIMF
ncbi:MAG: hypothetical protein MRZ79_24785 [Bacteroidia bacterium]|nr:hypothetical protein [Bacteroidia bacterium]